MLLFSTEFHCGCGNVIEIIFRPFSIGQQHFSLIYAFFKVLPSVNSAKDDETASHASHSTTYRSLFNLAGRTRKVTHRLDACFCSFYIFNKITIGREKPIEKKVPDQKRGFLLFFFYLLPFKNNTYFTVVNLSSYGHITLKFFQQVFSLVCYNICPQKIRLFQSKNWGGGIINCQNPFPAILFPASLTRIAKMHI